MYIPVPSSSRACRAPKIAPHPGFSGSGRIRAAWGKRRVASDPHRDRSTDRQRALNRPEKDKRAGFLSALQKATTPVWGRVRTRPRQPASPEQIGEMADADGRDLNAGCDCGNSQSWKPGSIEQRARMCTMYTSYAVHLRRQPMHITEPPCMRDVQVGTRGRQRDLSVRGHTLPFTTDAL